MPETCPMKKTSIGGQALIEGVMMRGPKKTAMAVRHVSGEIIEEEWENKTATRSKWLAWMKWPFVRGIFNMIDSLKIGYKCLMRSAELAGLDGEDAPKTEEEQKKESKLMNLLMIVSSVLGVVIAMVLFMWLPVYLVSLLGSVWHAATDQFVKSLLEGVLRIAVFLGYVVIISQMKDIRRVFMYHGAEHKSIFCYEKGLELTVDNVREQSRFHPRCGTSFLVLMLIVGVIVSILIPVTHPVWRTVCKLLTLPLTIAVGYELIKLAGRKDNRLTRALSAPGLWVQRITTREPEDGMIECAIASLKAVIPENAEDDRW